MVGICWSVLWFTSWKTLTSHMWVLDSCLKTHFTFRFDKSVLIPYPMYLKRTDWSFTRIPRLYSKLRPTRQAHNLNFNSIVHLFSFIPSSNTFGSPRVFCVQVPEFYCSKNPKFVHKKSSIDQQLCTDNWIYKCCVAYHNDSTNRYRQE